MKTRQLFLSAGLLIAAIVIVVCCQWPDQRIHLVMCDVGQGDAILITHGFKQTLIDTGLNDAFLGCLSRHIPIWDRKLELLIITHGDNDHSGGMKSAFKQYLVSSVLANPAVAQKLTVLGLLKAGRADRTRPVELFKPRVGECVKIDEKMKFCLVSPDVGQMGTAQGSQPNAETILSADDQISSIDIEDNNSESVVLFGYLDKVKVALMGDLPATEELALSRKGMIESVDILKVGHHGSKTSTNKTVLQKMSPEISLISVGKNNRFGHPAPEILERLTELGSKIYRTDKNGEIEVVIEEDQYWVSQNRGR